MSTLRSYETAKSGAFGLLAALTVLGGMIGGVISLLSFTLLLPPPPKLGTLNNKGIFAEQARRLADIKSQSPEMQVKSLAETLESYSKAVREVSKAHNVILLDQTAVATNVPDYTKAVEAKLFDKKAKTNE